MNYKTLDHIERFVEGVKWDVVIIDNQISIDMTIPETNHLPPYKQQALEERIFTLLNDIFESMRILEEFKGEVVSDYTCSRIKTYIHQKENESIDSGNGSIKRTIIEVLTGDECADNNKDAFYLMKYIVLNYS